MLPLVAAPAPAVRALAAAALGRAIPAAAAAAVTLVAVVAPPAVTPVLAAVLVPAACEPRVSGEPAGQMGFGLASARRTVVAPLHRLRRQQARRCPAAQRERLRCRSVPPAGAAGRRARQSVAAVPLRSRSGCELRRSVRRLQPLPARAAVGEAVQLRQPRTRTRRARAVPASAARRACWRPCRGNRRSRRRSRWCCWARVRLPAPHAAHGPPFGPVYPALQVHAVATELMLGALELSAHARQVVAAVAPAVEE